MSDFNDAKLAVLVREVGKAIEQMLAEGPVRVTQDALDDAQNALRDYMVSIGTNRVITHRGLAYRLDPKWKGLIITKGQVVD